MSQNTEHRNASLRISIIITDFNGWIQTRHCLEALRKSKFQKFDVILVDHGTNDETRQGLLREYPEVVRISGSKELWWTGATNLGIRKALEGHAPYIMLLNNDCNVKSDTIDILLDGTNISKNAVIAPIQLDLLTGRYLSITPSDFLALGFTTWSSGPQSVTREMRAKRVLPTRLISGGRGVLIPRKVIETVGILDEINLPHYCADHDFYFRCRSLGVPLYVAVNAEVEIDSSRTSSASRIEEMSWREFLHSLQDVRSHRNIPHLRALFKKHYPIRHLYFIGLWLSVARYISVYLVKRLRR